MFARLHDRPLRRLAAVLAAVGLSFAALEGCNSKNKSAKAKPKIEARYSVLPPKPVPPFLKDTIFQQCDLIYTEPFVISGYGLIVNLDGTGDSIAPNRVREYIVNEMVKHKWGSSLSGYKMPSPDEALRDPRVAIVQVDAFIPPGIRKGQRFDAQASALPQSNTSSLRGGQVLQTELRLDGANPQDPGGAVNALAKARGPVMVNPAYANADTSDAAARRSLRVGIMMNGAYAMDDRPIGLRLRTPSLKAARYLEERIDDRFQEIRPDIIAAAQDEGVVHFYVPDKYRGDWEHFANVVSYLYLNGSADYSSRKAEQLADEAVKPGSPMREISYCLEGLGKYALPVIRDRNLMNNPDPDVAFGAARAAAHLEDSSAPQVLVNMARRPGHPFQINAIQTLGALKSSPSINEMLRPLLNSPETLVRLETYRMLARNNDNRVFSRVIGEQFVLDVVRSDAPPLIYATRRGEPRIAVIGKDTRIDLPVTYTAMDNRLSISSDANSKTVTIFYRPPMPPRGVNSRKALEQVQPITTVSRPDIVDVIARLGGEGGEIGRTLNFNYGQIVSILNGLTAAQRLSSMADGQRQVASFVLEELPFSQDAIESAPVIGDHGRPTNDVQVKEVGMLK